MAERWPIVCMASVCVAVYVLRLCSEGVHPIAQPFVELGQKRS